MEPRAPLPGDLRLKLDGALLPGERLLWSAQPRPTNRLSGFLIWLFAIPWTGFALFWERAALVPWFDGGGSDAAIRYTFGILMPLFGLPFVLIGVAMLALPLLGLFGKRTPIVHALTDRRLITLRGGRWQQIKSVMVDRIGPVESKAGRDGWGSIAVQTHSRIDGEGGRVTEKFVMSGIPDVALVERLILEQQKH